MQRLAAPKVSDEHLIRREIYNPLKESIYFRLDQARVRYVHDSGIAVGPAEVECKPDGFCLLNHGYYVPFTKSGEGGNFITTFGADIGKGNKRPSKPVVERNGFTQ